MLLAACGVPSPSNTTTTTGETDAAEGQDEIGIEADEGSGDGNGLTEEGGEGEDEGQPLDCDAEVDALVSTVTRSDGGCSVLVRVHHETRTILGYQPTCAAVPDEPLDEAQARALTECCGSTGTALAEPEDGGPWVFWAAPGDGEPGEVSVVSSHVGARIFEASVGQGSATGELSFPEVWAGPQGLGEGCSAVTTPDPVSYDLVEGGSPLPAERAREVWGVVGSTALPLAMSTVGELRRIVVIRYPRTIDELDPSTAEFMVVIEAGVDEDGTLGD